jgi:hypothetical protein
MYAPPSLSDDSAVMNSSAVMSSTGSPFEITGFRTKKFENDDEHPSLIDSCIDSPEAMELLDHLHDIVTQCQLE